jgi:hypothetical protein
MKQFWSIPLSENVMTLNFQALREAQLEAGNGKLFDVITMDPPW